MNKLSFKDYLLEATGEITFSWGRMNPPTIGHEKLLNAVKKNASGKYVVYLSQSQDAKKNPLSYTDKVKFARKMFPRHARNIMMDKEIKTVFDLLAKFHKEGYSSVKMVVGSDRVNEFDALIKKYNGKEGRHGFYNFKDIVVVSAGERDPDADGVEGMSASKMRAAASANDLKLFSKGLPKGYKEGEILFNAVRMGMGLRESKNYRQHIQLPTVSQEREAFVNGDLFEQGDRVRVKITNEQGIITRLGSNYVLVQVNEDSKPKRMWLDSVEKINIEEALEDGTDELLKAYSDMTPGQSFHEIKKAYGAGLSKSTNAKRQAHFNKKSKIDDDDPRAYTPAPGDARAKTKTSKHTKKFAQMFGEETVNEDTKKALQKKADKTGISYGILKKVFDRGVAAWRTGHRPGTTPAQWGLARVNSFATKGKGTWGGADKDLAAKVRG